MSLSHDSFVYCSPLAPVLSLDGLLSPADQSDSQGIDLPDPEPDPCTRTIAGEHARAVGAYVDGLPDRERAVIKGVFWDGTPQRGIAADLNVSQPAVAKILNRVLSRARQELAHLA